jgi:hypothetical protein
VDVVEVAGGWAGETGRCGPELVGTSSVEVGAEGDSEARVVAGGDADDDVEGEGAAELMAGNLYSLHQLMRPDSSILPFLEPVLLIGPEAGAPLVAEGVSEASWSVVVCSALGEGPVARGVASPSTCSLSGRTFCRFMPISRAKASMKRWRSNRKALSSGKPSGK